MTKSEQMKTVLTKAGIAIRSLAVLGAWVHIDSFKKYEHPLRDLMAASGFQCVKISDGLHMDGTDGFRIVFKVN